jgi:hypothetical protein
MSSVQRKIAEVDQDKSLKRLIPTIANVELDDYLPIKEAAKTYKTSDDTLRRLLGTGKLTRFGRDYDKRIWLKRSELDAIFKPKQVKEDR